MRLAIFAASFVVLAVLAYAGVIPEGIGTANPLWLLALAILVSAPVSYVVLRRHRDEMSERIVEGVDRAKRKYDANRAMEDEADEAVRKAG
jgi:multisubunit Na+/H+ antiporter MnhG subunit